MIKKSTTRDGGKNSNKPARRRCVPYEYQKYRVNYTSNNNNVGNAKRTFVDHSYADHLFDPEGKPLSSADDGVSRRLIGSRGGVTVAFPEKLHEMLTTVDEEGCDDPIVSWQPHGRCFLVHQKLQFVENVMPR
jgi:hypothetical protein